MLRAAALSTGGLQSLPLIRQDLVVTGIATNAQVIEAIAIGRLSPGPNGIYLVSLGYEVAGWAGATAATLAVALPPLLLLPMIALAQRWLLSAGFAGAVRGVSIGAGGLLVATGLQIIAPGLEEGSLAGVHWWQGALAVAAVGLTLQGRLHPALLVIAGALAGNLFLVVGG